MRRRSMPIRLALLLGFGALCAAPALAGISHTSPTAAADPSALARAAPSAGLDVVSTTPAPVLSPPHAPGWPLGALATNGREKSRLAAASGALRTVALGGDITETVYALDAQQQLVGVDSTSQWPAAARQLPDVGYVRQLAAEGVLALRPQLIIATHDAGPPQAIAQLRDAGVRIETMPVTTTPADVAAKIRRIGQLLDRPDAVEQLARKNEGEYAALARDVAAMTRHPRVAFLMSAGSGSPLVAGRDTAASRAIALAGGINAGDGFAGYKPVSAEALAGLAPDAIVLMRERAGALGGIDGVLKLPGVRLTPAGRARRIVFVDGQALLGFGPRNAGRELSLQRELASVAP